MIAIDLDRHPGKQDGVRAFDDLVADRDLPETVTVETGGGGRHLLFRDPGVALRGGAIVESVEVRSGVAIVVAPPSTHATGTPYRWGPGRGPLDVDVADLPGWLLDVLRADRPEDTSPEEIEAPAASQAPARARSRRPSPAVAHLVRTGAYPDGDRRRSNPDQSASGRTMSALLGLRAAGLDANEAKAEILAHPTDLADRLHRVGDRGFLRDWRKAEKRHHDRPPIANAEAVEATLGTVLADARARRWRAKRGLSARAVLAALVAIARRKGSTEFAAAERDLAIRANLTRTTVRACLDHLMAEGLLERVQGGAQRTREGGSRRATVWRLVAQIDHSTSQGGGCPERGSVVNPNGLVPQQQDEPVAYCHPATRWKALGPGAPALLACLAAGGALRAREVASRLGRSAASISRNLRRAQAFGLVEQEPGRCGRWSLVALSADDLAERLERVAEVRGTGVALDRQVAEYGREREAFDAFAARFPAPPFDDWPSPTEPPPSLDDLLPFEHPVAA